MLLHKGYVISFASEMPNIASIEVSGKSIEPVEKCKLLGVSQQQTDMA